VNLKTTRKLSNDSRISVALTYEPVNMESRFSAGVLGAFAENHAHISQGVSVGRENQKTPLAGRRTRSDHTERERFDMAKKPIQKSSNPGEGVDIDIAAFLRQPAMAGFTWPASTDAPARFLKPTPATATIYFVGPKDGPIKIGYASRLAVRLKDLRLANAYPLEVWASVEGPPCLERQYHRRFASARLHGEWFTRTPEIEAEIARLTQLEQAA
jgi:hypothetical protein